MRIGIWVAAAAVLLAGAPVAFAHEGSPNFLSQVNSVTPADGIAVEVLNRDDRLLLRNDSGRTVVIEGYSGEPYARIDADGTVSVNTDSEAYYLNEERDGNVDAPDSADSKGEPRWEEVSKTGRFEWHDHRMHWMSEEDPEQVEDKSARSEVFDWKVPLEVDGRPGVIAGTLFWTPTSSSSLPLPAIFAFAALVIVLAVAVAIKRRRRAPPRSRGDQSARRRARGLVLLPQAASAHALLEATTPERGARLDAAPGQVTLRFSNMEMLLSRLQLVAYCYFLTGSDGDDKLRGQRGNDKLTGGSGRDLIEAGGGKDNVRARDGERDRINCGSGRDKVTADRLDKIAKNCERVTRRGGGS